MRVPLAFALLIASLAATARAQTDGAAMDMTGMGIYAMESTVRDAAGGGGGGNPKAHAASARRLRFTPSLARRRQNYARIATRAKARNPAAGAELARAFAQDPIAQAKGQFAQAGLRTDSVADAFGLWWVVAWDAAHGRELKPDRRQLAAVRAQAVRALSRNPKIVNASDAAKQEAADGFLVQALLIDASVEKTKGDPAARRRFGQPLGEKARKMGMDFDRLELTPVGFKVR